MLLLRANGMEGDIYMRRIVGWKVIEGEMILERKDGEVGWVEGDMTSAVMVTEKEGLMFSNSMLVLEFSRGLTFAY